MLKEKAVSAISTDMRLTQPRSQSFSPAHPLLGGEKSWEPVTLPPKAKRILYNVEVGMKILIAGE